jgi:Flp pilus assembly pilin Flp
MKKCVELNHASSFESLLKDTLNQMAFNKIRFALILCIISITLLAVVSKIVGSIDSQANFTPCNNSLHNKPCFRFCCSDELTCTETFIKENFHPIFIDTPENKTEPMEFSIIYTKPACDIMDYEEVLSVIIHVRAL